MAKNLYNSDNYVSYIKSRISEKKGTWGLMTEIAEACGCQKSHLSRVLQGKIELTMDQAAGLSDYFGLTNIESEYFLTLVQLARAGTKSLKQKLQSRLESIRKDQEDLSKRLTSNSIGVEEKEILYYSSWYWSAVHIIASIPEYQTTRAISQRLGLNDSFTEYILKTLLHFNLVSQVGSTWKTTTEPIHLSKKSSLIGLHHNNWRSRAVLSSQNPTHDGLHYTVVQSVSRSDFNRIKQLLLDAIEDYRNVANPSKEEEVACFCLDWFRA